MRYILHYTKWGNLLEAVNGELPDNLLVNVVTPTGGTGHAKLNKIAADDFNRMVAAAKVDGINITISQGYREIGSPDEGCAKGFTQWCAWKKYRAGTGNLAAKPGTSNHGFGSAIDVQNCKAGSPVHSWLVNNASKFGFYPLASEPWHWDHRSSIDDMQNVAGGSSSTSSNIVTDTQTPLANNTVSAIIHDLNLVKNGTQLLKSGSTGGAVKVVQQKLKEKRPDLFTKEPNGEFDKDTYNAIKAFQISEPNPIKDDGIVGPITYGKLFDVQINPVATGSDKLSGSYSTSRDNNPFNLRPNRKTQFNGYVGKKEAFRGTQSIGNFAVFDTMTNGIRAGMKNLEGYFTRRNLNTISQIINTYAPGGSAGQPQSATNSYVNRVVSYMQKNWNPNVTATTPLSFSGPTEMNPDNIKMFKALVSAIAKQEGKLTPELVANINSFDTKNLA